MLSKLILALFTLSTVTNAHFILNYPHSLGFDDDIESNGPCGGFPVKFSPKDTKVPVNGFAVAMLTTHPEADWLFRATVSKKAPYTWSDLLPVVQQTSVGHFCLPHLHAPAGFAGKEGLIQVIQHGPDGILYQCAAVNFVTGKNSTVGPTCNNATGLTATITNSNNINNTTPPLQLSDSASASSASASATSSPNAGTSQFSTAGWTPVVVLMGLVQYLI